MKIFLTGASGYIGRNIADKLVARGHDVIGMARKPSHRTIGLDSVEWCYVDLADVDRISQVANDCDSIIHCAMNYSESGHENVELDFGFIQQILKLGRFLIYTGNLYSSRTDPENLFAEEIAVDATDWRLRHEQIVMSADSPAAVIRVGFVYGGAGGYLWDMLPPAALSQINIDDINPVTWPMIHVRDLATLYATVAEQQLDGVFHAWDGAQVTAGNILEILVDVYAEIQSAAIQIAGDGANEHIFELLRKSVITTNLRALSTGWNPEFTHFRDHAAMAYQDYLSVQSRP